MLLNVLNGLGHVLKQRGQGGPQAQQLGGRQVGQGFLLAFVQQPANLLPNLDADALHPLHDELDVRQQGVGLFKTEQSGVFHNSVSKMGDPMLVSSLYPLCKQRPCIMVFSRLVHTSPELEEA